MSVHSFTCRFDISPGVSHKEAVRMYQEELERNGNARLTPYHQLLFVDTNIEIVEGGETMSIDLTEIFKLLPPGHDVFTCKTKGGTFGLAIGLPDILLDDIPAFNRLKEKIIHILAIQWQA